MTLDLSRAGHARALDLRMRNIAKTNDAEHTDSHVVRSKVMNEARDEAGIHRGLLARVRRRRPCSVLSRLSALFAYRGASLVLVWQMDGYDVLGGGSALACTRRRVLVAKPCAIAVPCNFSLRV
jgi:hypothetical protein